MKSASPRRWRLKLRFGLRTLFLAVAVMATFTAWLRYQIDWIRQRAEIGKTHQLILNGLCEVPTGTIRPSAPWPLQWLGEPGYLGVLVEDTTSDAELQRIVGLFPESVVLRN